MAVEAKDELCRGRALWQMGAARSASGAWKDAEAPLQQSLTVLQQVLGNSHLDLARIYNGTRPELQQHPRICLPC